MAGTAQGHDAHGQSVASWTAVTILMVAALVMSLAVAWSNTGIFVAGAVLALVGVIAGKVLAMAGFGLHKPGRTQSDSGIG